jgi:hypothetical protein
MPNTACLSLPQQAVEQTLLNEAERFTSIRLDTPRLCKPGKDGGDDPAVAKRALECLYERACFLEYDGYKYRFKTEPSLNKIIDDERGSVSTPRAKEEIDATYLFPDDAERSRR